MDDLDKTMQPRRHSCVIPDNDVTLPGKRDRKPDGRFSVGDLIMNRYKVLDELGQGGMGVVYKCFDEISGIEVALKAFPSELSHNMLEMEDIKDNFQLIHNLHHPNIASSNTLEKDERNGNYYLIMECCEGEDLRRWIRRKHKEGEVTLDDILPIVRQVSEALDYAHEMKIMHRDVKPGNIMIDRLGKIKVLDFGLAAQIHTSMTRVSMAYYGTSGTGPYMAPEQWEGRIQNAWADQYALAVMTYEMLSGHTPFESTDAAVLREAVLKSNVIPLKNIPQTANLAIRRALSKEPAERFASCSDFTAALGGKKSKVGQSAPNTTFHKWAAAAILLAVLASSVIGYYFFDEHRKEKIRLERLEKERQIKLAEEKRISEEKAGRKQQEKLAEEKLAKENKALKDELRKKIAKIQKNNYDQEVIFKKKIKDMQKAYSIVDQTKSLTIANKNYKEAERLADLILNNGALLESVRNIREKAKKHQIKADKYEPLTYATNLYTTALLSYQMAEKFYNETNFFEAKKYFETSAKEFEKCENLAFDNKVKFLTEAAQDAEKHEKWQEVKVWAKQLQSLNKSLANHFETKAERKLKEIAARKKYSPCVGKWICKLEVSEEKIAHVPSSLHLFAELAPVSTEIHLNLNDDNTVEIHEKSGRMFGLSNGKYEFTAETGILSMELKNTVTGQKYTVSGFVHWLDKDKQKFELDFEDFEYSAILFSQLKSKEGLKVHAVNSSVRNSSKSLSIGIVLSEKNQNIQFTTLNVSKYIFKKQ